MEKTDPAMVVAVIALVGVIATAVTNVAVNIIRIKPAGKSHTMSG